MPLPDKTRVMSKSRCIRRRYVVFIAAALMLLAHVGVAPAATAPSLSSPASGADYTESTKITFEWSGSLQGDADAISRSFFRVEVALTSDVPSGTQTEWGDDILVNYARTNAGVQDTDVDMGTPEPGKYSWRVCAWGVVDDSVDSSLERLPSGCSSKRSLDAVAAVDSSDTTSSTVHETGDTITTTTGGGTITKTVPGKTITLPAKNTTKTLPLTEDQKVTAQEPSVASVFGSDGTSASATQLGEGVAPGKSSDSSSSGLGGLTSALGGSLPFVPIPYWTLALLGAAIPLALWWRKGTLGMFEWNDDEDFQELPMEGTEPTFKSSAKNADGLANTGTSPPGEVPR